MLIHSFIPFHPILASKSVTEDTTLDGEGGWNCACWCNDKNFNYSGTMFYAEVSNMKESEGKLLKNKYRDNSQYKSNLKSDDEGSGCIYLIKEE